MVSILIPTYNYDCTRLVCALRQQAEALRCKVGADFGYEILVLDDGSEARFADLLREGIDALPRCRVLSAGGNVGRAAGVNFLVAQAQYPWCIVIDSDAEVCTADFLERYWDARHEADVVCGALRNPELRSVKGHELRYRYEKAAEKRRPATYRNAHPYACFSTFNVMFHKRVFDTLRFDEQCREYGYEDALMGLMLGRKGFSIVHIDNPLIHLGIDSNESFLMKTEAALRTLCALGEPMQSAAGASRVYRRLRQLRLVSPVLFLFKVLRPTLRRNLLGSKPSLLLFNVYKVGYYCYISRNVKEV